MDIWIRNILILFLAAAVFAGCGSSGKKTGVLENTEHEIDTVEENTQPPLTEEKEEESSSQDEAEAAKETAKKRLAAELEAAGITQFQRVNVEHYEMALGLSLSDEYVSYRFLYDSDGYRIEAFISAPVGLLQEGMVSPCLIYNHGGNRDFGALRNGDLRTCRYAEQFQTICIASNYRGCGHSEGEDEFGGDDVNDVIHLIDLCEKLSFIDKDRINMLGISRGGMMTYETLRMDSRIHRAAVVSGAADCFMAYEDRDDMKPICEELIGGTPQELPEEYERRSATCWADEIHTPVLIFHTTGDWRVRIREADKLVEQLEKAGADYEYVVYESDSHGEIRKEDAERIREWFE